MLRTGDELRGFALRSGEDELGTLEDLYFDDVSWTVRYLVVDTGGWLVQKRVLISPWAVTEVDGLNETFDTALTKAQVEAAPAPDAHAPVDRQFEIAYHEYYRYSPYWVTPAAWTASSAPLPPEDAAPREERQSWDSHLFSIKNLTGFSRYRVKAADGELGHVSEALIADEDWVIRYLIVATRDWLPGKRVLIPPHWTTVDWENRTIAVDLPRDAIKTAPAYDESTEVTRDYEDRLFRHYCRAAYWQNDDLCHEPPGRRPPGDD